MKDDLVISCLEIFCDLFCESRGPTPHSCPSRVPSLFLTLSFLFLKLLDHSLAAMCPFPPHISAAPSLHSPLLCRHDTSTPHLPVNSLSSIPLQTLAPRPACPRHSGETTTTHHPNHHVSSSLSCHSPLPQPLSPSPSLCSWCWDAETITVTSTTVVHSPVTSPPSSCHIFKISLSTKTGSPKISNKELLSNRIRAI